MIAGFESRLYVTHVSYLGYFLIQWSIDTRDRSSESKDGAYGMTSSLSCQK